MIKQANKKPNSRGNMNNYHIHTKLCKHAEGSVIDYVSEAVKNKSTHIGISDHTPLPDNQWLRYRMEVNQLEGYLTEINDAKKAFPNIKIYSGLESEFTGEYFSFYKDFILDECKLDYLIGSVHYIKINSEWRHIYRELLSKKEISIYAKYIISAIESGLFSFMAHPDSFTMRYHPWDAEAKAVSKDILSWETSYIKFEISLLYDFIETGNSCAFAVLIRKVSFSGISTKVSKSKSFVVIVFGFVAPTIDTLTSY